MHEYVIVAVVVAQLTLCVWLIAFYRHKLRDSEGKLMRLNERLEEAVKMRTDELTGLTRHLLTVREEEKSRIARELHDELGSSLTAVNMDLAWVRQRLDDQPLATRLGRAAEVLTSTVEMKRRIIHDLRPTMLDNLGLSSAIESHATDFSERIRIPVEIDVPDELPKLKEGCPIALFRILEEALDNTSRHAAATRISVSLRLDGTNLVMEVIDDGIGMNAAGPGRNAPSYGLLSMRERVLQMNGTLDIGAGPAGRGTTVRVVIPCVAVVVPDE